MLIDAHVHLDKYGDLLNEALKQIESERIFTVATAMDIPSYLELRKIGERSNLVLPTFGIHPRRAAEYADRLAELGRYIEMSPAIGEIGLDFHWVKDASTYAAQRKVLEYFIVAAAERATRELNAQYMTVMMEGAYTEDYIKTAGADAPVDLAIVRGADTAHPELAPQAAGLLAASLGLSRMYADDLEQLDAGMLLYDALYRWCRDATDETHDWVSHTAKTKVRA